MAFSGNFMCTSFKQELLRPNTTLQIAQGYGKLAMYTNSASLMRQPQRTQHLMRLVALVILRAAAH